MSKIHGSGGRFDARMTRSPLRVEVPAGNPLHFERLTKVSKPVRSEAPAIATTLLRVSVDP